VPERNRRKARSRTRRAARNRLQTPVLFSPSDRSGRRNAVRYDFRRGPPAKQAADSPSWRKTGTYLSPFRGRTCRSPSPCRGRWRSP
jgi:hypothetical protein